MKKATISTYRKDKYYPRIVRAVAEIMSRSDVFAPVEVMMEMGNLSKMNYESWRKGQVPYLERVFKGNLSKANRILRILSFHAQDLNPDYSLSSMGHRQKARFAIFEIGRKKYRRSILKTLSLESVIRKKAG